MQHFRSDVADYDGLLSSEGIEHTTERPAADGPPVGLGMGSDRPERDESGQRRAGGDSLRGGAARPGGRSVGPRVYGALALAGLLVVVGLGLYVRKASSATPARVKPAKPAKLLPTHAAAYPLKWDRPDASWSTATVIRS